MNERYNYYFNICQNGYKDDKNKDVSYARGFCDGINAEYPYVNANTYLTGKRKSSYYLGYYNALCLKYPNYRNSRKKNNV